MKTAAEIRNRLEKAGISGNINYIILRILQELDRKENRSEPKKAVSYWLEKIQRAHKQKWQEAENAKKSLDSEEIRMLFAKR